jgi:16S rRNA (cytosine1402-N4)-methyltransferase
MMDRMHVPVLKEEILGFLKPGPGRRFVDGTFGFGGHSEAFLDAGADVLGLDLDGEAVAACRRISTDRPQLQCQQRSFRELGAAVVEAGWPSVDGVLLDLGVSSRQLDDPDKGFSYRADGPLDLRFDQQRGQPAHALLVTLDETELARILFEYGEERGSRRLARAIKSAQQSGPLQTTGQLAGAVREALPSNAPINAVLSRVFQALRIAVNDELLALEDALAATISVVHPGGRIAVIAYHSLEDRRVKQWLARERRDCLCPPSVPVCQCGHKATLKAVTRRPVSASDDEIRSNPRARSARLRVAEVLPPSGEEAR